MPVVPRPGNESPPRDPFTPYDVGPEIAKWAYADLTVAERAVVDRGRATSRWEATQDSFAAAAQERAGEAAASAAGLALGVDDLATIGVVP